MGLIDDIDRIIPVQQELDNLSGDLFMPATAP